MAVRCLVCSHPIAGKVLPCPRCDTGYHAECAAYAGACAVYGYGCAAPVPSPQRA